MRVLYTNASRDVIVPLWYFESNHCKIVGYTVDNLMFEKSYHVNFINGVFFFDLSLSYHIQNCVNVVIYEHTFHDTLQIRSYVEGTLTCFSNIIIFSWLFSWSRSFHVNLQTNSHTCFLTDQVYTDVFKMCKDMFWVPFPWFIPSYPRM